MHREVLTPRSRWPVVGLVAASLGLAIACTAALCLLIGAA